MKPDAADNHDFQVGEYVVRTTTDCVTLGYQAILKPGAIGLIVSIPTKPPRGDYGLLLVRFSSGEAWCHHQFIRLATDDESVIGAIGLI